MDKTQVRWGEELEEGSGMNGANFSRSAPKGRNATALGNALGTSYLKRSALKGRYNSRRPKMALS